MSEPVFVPQFDPAESVETRIANRDAQDSNLPEWNWCGICCVRMVALGLELDPPSLDDMYKTAFEMYAVFKIIDGRVIGAYHEALAAYIRGEFKLDAKAVRHRSALDVHRLVKNGAWFIASVSAEIRHPGPNAPEKKTGHLVLVFEAFREDDLDGFRIHNSTGFSSTDTQSHVRVSAARFADCFSECGILILPSFAR